MRREKLMDQVKAGTYTATIRLANINTQKDGTPKVGVCWDIGQEKGVWQDLILKDSATKFLDWQLNILDIKSEVNLAATDLNVRAQSLKDAIEKINAPQYATKPKFNIDISYRPFNGKDYMSIAVKSKVENMAPQATSNPAGDVDQSEPLPF